jgi:hypothetical protein
MKMVAAISLVVLTLAVSQTVSCTTKDKLVRDLTSDYLAVVDPGHSKLELGLSFQCVLYDKQTGLLTSRLMEGYKWTDERLKWNPSEYDGINNLRLPTKLLWVPDVKLYNAYTESETRDEANAVVSSDGSVLWIPPAIYVTRCTPSGESSANCHIQIGSWTYNTETLPLKSFELDTSMYLDNCPFTISDQTQKIEAKEYPCCPNEKYASLHVSFTVKPRH